MGTTPVLEHFNQTDGWYRPLQDLPMALDRLLEQFDSPVLA